MQNSDAESTQALQSIKRQYFFEKNVSICCSCATNNDWDI
jgi:hypothetical protein